MFEGFLDHYAGMLGGIAIATSTMLAVFLKRHHFKNTENYNARYHGTSFSSAIAAELIDNADRLVDFYLYIDQAKSKTAAIINYHQLDTLAYETMLDRMGRLGPGLSFMVVDVYGDIRALKAQYDNLQFAAILDNRDDYLEEIQMLLVKTISCAAIMYVYADYMSGKKWSKTIAPHRLLWLEREIEKFLQYIGKIDSDLDYVTTDDVAGISFIKRIGDADKRATVRDLFVSIDLVLKSLHKSPTWKAQLTLRGAFYKIKNTLLFLLDVSPNPYDLRSEHEYSEFLPKERRDILGSVIYGKMP